MKRSRENKDEFARPGAKKPKSISACTSCKKHKTRCEILDPSKNPVRCHRCQVLTIPCSYEGTILPTASTSKLPTPTILENTEAEKPRSNAMVAYPSQLPPTDRIWAFVTEDHSGIDWSAPMLAIQHLSRLPFASFDPPREVPQALSVGDLTLSAILNEERQRYLLDLFDERYTPWLNFKPIRNANGSLLDIVCCAIASRHLENVPGSAQVKTELQRLTEDSIAKMIFNPRPSESVEAIQALLILSLWAPLGGPPENEGRDGRLLIASAVSMAMNLRLNQASRQILALRKKNGGRHSPEDSEVLQEMLEKARLWIALTNTESMLCVGTGRVPLSRRSPEDLQLVEYPKSFNDLVNYGDLRLGLTASSFDLVEEGNSNRLQSGMDIDAWYDEIMIVLERLKRIKRLLAPLPVVLDYHQFYFHMLQIYEDMSRVLVIYHALQDARASAGPIPSGESWHAYFRPHNTEAVGEMGRDLLQTVESLLIHLVTADTRLLNTAPDNLFTMVALAAGYLIGVKFLMARGGSHLLGGSDLILAKTVTHLTSVAVGPGHAAQRAALLLKGMIAKWEGRASVVASYPTPTSDRPTEHTVTTTGNTPIPEFLEPSSFPGQQPLTLPPFELDFNMFMDSTVPLNPDFWNNMAHMPGYE
ncbi:hypothetical protein B0H16DRAFT_379069 [Mycena metata]|uniref:Zn(2)-C6 fungal-type domain-containing protein n=1 Tax=Mycena metata TaxID=1033252 RepID=A0AAD7MJY3_9AGAR|nr:hypothetical protein B0H16DRAFT_379069 [Mycena metata]